MLRSVHTALQTVSVDGCLSMIDHSTWAANTAAHYTESSCLAGMREGVHYMMKSQTASLHAKHSAQMVEHATHCRAGSSEPS